ncbi:MAG: glycosyltransferase family 4 protein [Bacteroidales bacterium]|nr:glycosyltransferase family 4 protein [Bacteroidales bacterium]
MKKKVFISVINDLVSDQRVHRTAVTLSAAGYAVELIGRRFPASADFKMPGINIRRFRLFFNKGFPFYASFNIRLFFYLLFRSDVALLLSIDLDTLPANFLVSKIRGIKLMYDSHEYFTEVPELNGRNFVKRFWLTLEKMMVPHVDAAYSVNESLAKMYSAKYGIEFGVIRNVPSGEIEEEDFVLPPEFAGTDFIIYQGAVNKDRGLEELIDIIADQRDIRLVIAGDGDVLKSLKQKVDFLDLSGNVYFTGKIPPSRLKNLTRQAKLGVSLEKKSNLNYYYSLPNKIFDYIQAGIPVLCSGFPEMKEIIRIYGTGRTVDPGNKEEIRSELIKMLWDEESRAEWIKNTESARKKLSWDVEQKKLGSIYEKVGIRLDF